MMILIDSGNTHNIIQPCLACHLQLDTSSTSPFKVMVSNGEFITCEQLCYSAPIIIQQAIVRVPLYVIPIEGADMVLEVAWLRTLSPIQADFSVPTLTFMHHDTSVTLTGDSVSLTFSSFHQLCHYVQQDSVASLHLLQVSHPEPNPQLPFLDSLPTFYPTKIKTLLTNYQDVFQKPKGFPPNRPQDHHIPLLPNSTPINVKPYRYLHSQKALMTTLITKMLTDGIIKPSTSPFSSPVLLVKK